MKSKKKKKRKEEGLNKKFIKIQYSNLILCYIFFFGIYIHFQLPFYTNYLIRLKDTHHRVNLKKKMSKNYCEQKKNLNE